MTNFFVSKEECGDVDDSFVARRAAAEGGSVFLEDLTKFCVFVNMAGKRGERGLVACADLVQAVDTFISDQLHAAILVASPVELGFSLLGRALHATPFFLPLWVLQQHLVSSPWLSAHLP